jgi:hypothetical protein
MTTEQLQVIKDRCNATSIAPWVASIEGRDHESGSSFIMTGIPKGEDIWQEKRGEDLEISGATNADLDFIASARQDIPALIAEVERMQKIVEEKNSLGIPINADGIFEKISNEYATFLNTDLNISINEYEVLFAKADVAELNSTQIFNWGMKYGQTFHNFEKNNTTSSKEINERKIVATDNNSWKNDETILNITVEITEPHFEENVWQTILKMNGNGTFEYKLYGQSSIQALIFALQHTKLQLMILIEDGYLWYDEPTNSISTKEESIEVLNAIYGRGTLLDEEHTKANIILSIKRLQNAKGNEDEQNMDINYLKKMFTDPNIIDYIYHPKTEMTAAEIYEKAKAYKPIQL